MASVWQCVCEFIATAVTGFKWLAPKITSIDALRNDVIAVFRMIHAKRTPPTSAKRSRGLA